MRSILCGIALLFATAQADNIDFSGKLGQYYFSGISSNGFLGAGKQELPKGFLGTSAGLEFRINHNVIEAGIISNEKNDVKWFAGTTFFTRDGGNSAFLKAVFVYKWMHEENWDWNENDNFTYIDEKDRNLIVVEVGYRMDFDFFMLDASIGAAKG